MTGAEPGLHEQDDVDDVLPAATAAAATQASRDAESVAQSVAHTAAASQTLHVWIRLVLEEAKLNTALEVAAAAAAAVEIAALQAVIVKHVAEAQAAAVAAAAAAALERAAEESSGDIDPASARDAASATAADVAEQAATQAGRTGDAAARVARAVALDAEAAVVSASTAVERAEADVSSTEAFVDDVTRSGDRTRVASGVAVNSASHVVDLAAARLAVLRQAPLIRELRQALRQDELRLRYQPIYRTTTGEFVAVEALLRWQHPTRGLLYPSHFMDVVEAPQLVTPVGDWVIRTAVEQGAAWQDAYGEAAPRVWVNVTCDQLGRRHLVDVVVDCLARTGLAPQRLGLEVTERQLARRIDEVVHDLQAVSAHGVALAVDDFGTGYASLDYLRRLPFDEIKIDRTFVSGHQDSTNAAITASIVELGRRLGLVVVAEGVETPQQHAHLQTLGCELNQGYLLHRPAPPDMITDLIAVTRAPTA